MAKSSGEFIHHIVGVRIRAVGTGVLKSRLSTLDDIRTSDLADLTLSATNEREPTLLANFQSQRIRYEFWQEGGNFRINRIIIYTKPVATEYPQ